MKQIGDGACTTTRTLDMELLILVVLGRLVTEPVFFFCQDIQIHNYDV